MSRISLNQPGLPLNRYVQVLSKSLWVQRMVLLAMWLLIFQPGNSLSERLKHIRNSKQTNLVNFDLRKQTILRVHLDIAECMLFCVFGCDCDQKWGFSDLLLWSSGKWRFLVLSIIIQTEYCFTEFTNGFWNLDKCGYYRTNITKFEVSSF
jgi:hypothetical protein